MKKQLARGLHSLKGKMNKTFTAAKRDAEPAAEGREPAAGDLELHGIEPRRTIMPVERRELERLIDHALAVGGQGCLLIADIDRFRALCGLYGADAGDALLQHVTAQLGAIFPEAAYLCRQGSDTFALWLPGVSGDRGDGLRLQAGVLNDRLLHPEDMLPPVTLSIGMAFGSAGEDYRSLGRKAVGALNRVKESGRCGCEIYDND